VSNPCRSSGSATELDTDPKVTVALSGLSRPRRLPLLAQVLDREGMRPPEGLRPVFDPLSAVRPGSVWSPLADAEQVTCRVPHDDQAAGTRRLRVSRYRAESAQLLPGQLQVIDPQVQVSLHRHV